MNQTNFDPQNITVIDNPDGSRVVITQSGDIIFFNRFGHRIGTDWTRPGNAIWDWIVSFVSSHPGAVASQTCQ